jgi:hypothetical protein
MNISWKKGLFSTAYQLFYGNQKAGYLKERTWSRKADGVLMETQVSFRKKGVFSSEAEIFDAETKKKLGEIEMSFWGNKTSITLDDKVFNWRFSNSWNSKWELLEGAHPIIKYKSGLLSGKAESQIEDELMLLTGLFIYNHFTQIMLFISIISAVIIISVSS